MQPSPEKLGCDALNVGSVSLVPSDNYVEGAKRGLRGLKGKISLSKRQRLLTITNYSLLITN